MKFIFRKINLIISLIFLTLLFYLKSFFSLYADQLFLLTYQHLRLIIFAMPPAIVLGVGLGILSYRYKRMSVFILSSAGVMFTIPSIALFGVMIPVLSPLGAGVGSVPAIIALILYSQLPIIRNTLVGLNNIPQSILKSARGMGMTSRQILFKIQLPLAAPIILSGIRLAIVMAIGIAAIAAYIGAGGLGRWIFGGIRRTYPDMVLAGALCISLMAIGAEILLRWFQSYLTHKAGLVTHNQ